ncbi:uncharacterized protein A4U43_UnF10100 [Asparagus officinalis]|uniref:Uncharacterized protein n=1 Tax=Asparagus officinalis TaxID=4686 RepID=A0A1R3L5J2_ASPOF|nr:uncharacterized protein A4U43_UnF10100 [Asparagus officinalis]
MAVRTMREIMIGQLRAAMVVTMWFDAEEDAEALWSKPSLRAKAYGRDEEVWELGEYRTERLSAKELRRRIESEARVTEYFDESNEELDCAGVLAVRRTVSMVGRVLRPSLK